VRAEHAVWRLGGGPPSAVLRRAVRPRTCGTQAGGVLTADAGGVGARALPRRGCVETRSARTMGCLQNHST
jgi:hypothetical protein